MIDRSQLGPPIDVRGLFPRERKALLDLLGGLAAGDWELATVCPGWTVKDVTAHVLHDDLRRLASMRDGHQGPRPEPGEPVAAFLDRVNQEWVAATRCLSSRQLVDLLTLSGGQIAALWRALDPDAGGAAVSWAGLEVAPVWLDAARELSEYWTHQQQIREATGRPGLTDRQLLAPVLDTFLRALPYTLRDTGADPGTQVQVTVSGDGQRPRPDAVGGHQGGHRMGPAPRRRRPSRGHGRAGRRHPLAALHPQRRSRGRRRPRAGPWGAPTRRAGPADRLHRLLTHAAYGWPAAARWSLTQVPSRPR